MPHRRAVPSTSALRVVPDPHQASGNGFPLGPLREVVATARSRSARFSGAAHDFSFGFQPVRQSAIVWMTFAFPYRVGTMKNFLPRCAVGGIHPRKNVSHQRCRLSFAVKVGRQWRRRRIGFHRRTSSRNPCRAMNDRISTRRLLRRQRITVVFVEITYAGERAAQRRKVANVRRKGRPDGRERPGAISPASPESRRLSYSG